MSAHGFPRVTIPGVHRSEEIMATIKAQAGGTVLLSFSRGKDSIAAWLALRDAGFTVIPYYLYFIWPMLSFEQDSIDYYEQRFQTKIHLYPEPALYRKLANFIFQPLNRVEAIDSMALPLYDYDDIASELSREQGFPERLWQATGVRAADSTMRRSTVKATGGINKKRKVFLPVWDWTLAELLARLKGDRVALPVDYDIWGRSFDGIDWHFLQPMRDRLPDDYARVVAAFPFVEAFLWREKFQTAKQIRDHGKK